MTAAFDPETLAVLALDWLTAQAREDDEGGIAWPAWASAEEVHHDLYNGGAGIIPAYVAAAAHFGEDRYAEIALRAARTLARADEGENPTLFFGHAGIAVILGDIAERYGDEGCAKTAERIMDRVRERFDGRRFTEHFELMSGNAGFALAALVLGDADFAVRALQAYVDEAIVTGDRVNWLRRDDAGEIVHHHAHGTLGVVHALAVVGHATGRADLVDLAARGAADVIARDEQAPEGFLVPHSDPQFRPDGTPRYSYGWCNGTAGDADALNALARATGDPKWTDLVSRCWYTVTRSGLPRRVRPGFWDNNGRCCGTAGVLAFAVDRQAGHGDALDFAATLHADLADRATVDASGARWSNHAYRDERPDLEPCTGWGQGNAGIVPELLRYARLLDGRDPSVAFALPGVG
ncbi:hypothetical protein Afil01_24630 [Actinorhabdospora filicis]|uniref:Lanthionine synthetase C family protein n=1 Tax=Actinorhabdospora filicis TaxID=1785913 RepID=A0A9W6SKZ1_9ACTN|nr:lanthionine synthetase LanC family protein [Actinorhabdospora filicis]GLZ77656.1 hypothetical protein Afil01_24630 [Actinorhabdospora filicis]